MSRHEAPKNKKVGKPPTIEHVSKTISTNFYVKIGLTREELHALKHVAENFEHKQYRKTGNALMLLVTTALMHWEKIEPFVHSDEAYWKAEGFAHREIFQRDYLYRKFSKLN